MTFKLNNVNSYAKVVCLLSAESLLSVFSKYVHCTIQSISIWSNWWVL